MECKPQARKGVQPRLKPLSQGQKPEKLGKSYTLQVRLQQDAAMNPSPGPTAVLSLLRNVCLISPVHIWRRHPKVLT